MAMETAHDVPEAMKPNEAERAEATAIGDGCAEYDRRVECDDGRHEKLFSKGNRGEHERDEGLHGHGHGGDC
eukprot:15477812-Alexandrium_andersonii.AAC.1